MQSNRLPKCESFMHDDTDAETRELSRASLRISCQVDVTASEEIGERPFLFVMVADWQHEARHLAK